jgi:hypothetical protein
MSDWVYIVGEGSFNQDFLIINQETNEPLPLTGAITMFITDSAYANPVPSAAGQPMSIVTNANGLQVARLAVTAINMPTVAGIYLVQIKIDASSTLKTFFMNLRVIRSITS